MIYMLNKDIGNTYNFWRDISGKSNKLFEKTLYVKLWGVTKTNRQFQTNKIWKYF